ncbi:MAG TPA: nicotinate-nicotinamide nucleotide adenylyltransferase, partial [Agitococcus sp.]|nr:nicotinate-nicotinamide nucleotide adenylyltransferase [Agitococcus sp.]
MSHLIAYFGGSFDPVHQGHLATAKFLVDYFKLHKLFFLPAYLSPLKSQSLAAHHRVAMLKLAIQNQTHFALDEQEILQPSKSYTINTLKNLRQVYD